jgi:HD superfamily phosphohydrolase
MSKWGLTLDQRKAKPWDIEEDELRPSKTITDPVHRDIYLTKLERRIVDSRPMQRLRRVRQLGTTHLIYPAATHTRFSHSLGALRAAQNLLDVVIEQHEGNHPKRDLFQEWKDSLSPPEYNRNIAEAVVLTRLGALMHDMCHVSYGHSVEDDLGILIPHDENAERFDVLWNQFPKTLRRILSGRIKDQLRPLVLSKIPCRTNLEYPFVADIVGNTICADLIDYLQRDHYFTGLPAKVGDRFIQGFYVTPSDHVQKPQSMVIQISRGRRERRDVSSELFKYLRYRYELSERALVHHAKLSADAMLGKLFEIWKDELWNQFAIRKGALKEYFRDIAEARRFIVLRKREPDLPSEIDAEVNSYLEHVFLSYGDDGLLEHILNSTRQYEPYSPKQKEDLNSRQRAIVHLADSLMNRQLFKPIGFHSNRADAERLYVQYGGGTSESRQRRRALEEEVAKFADLKHSWDVVLWVPLPNMRLKAALVLVDDEEGVTTLKERDKAKGGNRGNEIYEAHENLWSINVYVHPSVVDEPGLGERVLARLSQRMGISTWKQGEPGVSLERLLAEECARRYPHLTFQQIRDLEASATTIAAHGGDDTFSFSGMVDRLSSLVSLQQELPFESIGPSQDKLIE